MPVVPRLHSLEFYRALYPHLLVIKLVRLLTVRFQYPEEDARATKAKDACLAGRIVPVYQV
jgi:hypothetical protein